MFRVVKYCTNILPNSAKSWLMYKVLYKTAAVLGGGGGSSKEVEHKSTSGHAKAKEPMLPF